jgi:hypothetical protein
MDDSPNIYNQLEYVSFPAPIIAGDFPDVMDSFKSTFFFVGAEHCIRPLIPF